jgi:hypothetical protein
VVSSANYVFSALHKTTSKIGGFLILGHKVRKAHCLPKICSSKADGPLAQPHSFPKIS